jgi:hypothetical protein
MVLVNQGDQAIQVQAVYPQPFSELLVVQFTAPVNHPVHLQLFDLSGRVIQQANLTPNGKQLLWDFGSNLPAGMYIIQLTDNEFHFSQKVIHN